LGKTPGELAAKFAEQPAPEESRKITVNAARANLSRHAEPSCHQSKIAPLPAIPVEASLQTQISLAIKVINKESLFKKTIYEQRQLISEI
jgi:hypothetical protein